MFRRRFLLPLSLQQFRGNNRSVAMRAIQFYRVTFDVVTTRCVTVETYFLKSICRVMSPNSDDDCLSCLPGLNQVELLEEEYTLTSIFLGK